MSRLRPVLVVLCVVMGAGAAFAAWRFGDPAPQTRSTGIATVGGPFTLVDTNGKTVDQSLLVGKWSAVFFGFTYCPDVCPTTLQTLRMAEDRLGPRGRDLQTVFISVDPERDTPAQLKTYLDSPSFPKAVVGLTGSPDQVAAAVKAYRGYFQKEGEGDDYLINHTSAVYLMDPRGRFNRVLAYSLTPDEIAAQVAAAMREESAKL